MPGTSARLLVIEALKLVLSLTFSNSLQTCGGSHRDASRQTTSEDEGYLTGETGDILVRHIDSQAHENRRAPASDAPLRAPALRSSAPYIALTAALYAFYNYNVWPNLFPHRWKLIHMMVDCGRHRSHSKSRIRSHCIWHYRRPLQSHYSHRTSSSQRYLLLSIGMPRCCR